MARAAGLLVLVVAVCASFGAAAQPPIYTLGVNVDCTSTRYQSFPIDVELPAELNFILQPFQDNSGFLVGHLAGEEKRGSDGQISMRDGSFGLILKKPLQEWDFHYKFSGTVEVFAPSEFCKLTESGITVELANNRLSVAELRIVVGDYRYLQTTDEEHDRSIDLIGTWFKDDLAYLLGKDLRWFSNWQKLNVNPFNYGRFNEWQTYGGECDRQRWQEVCDYQDFLAKGEEMWGFVSDWDIFRGDVVTSPERVPLSQQPFNAVIEGDCLILGGEPATPVERKGARLSLCQENGALVLPTDLGAIGRGGE